MDVNYDHWGNIIRNGVDSFNIVLTDHQIRQFFMHAEELQRWTRKTNLTAIKDVEQMAIKHFIDSVAPSIYFKPMGNVLDIGSGGGFPGLPLKILYPHIRLTLIDTVRKKASFLKHMVRILKLKETNVINGRVEAICQQDKGALFDTIICRAYSNVSVILKNALPLLSSGGQILIWKGPSPEEEIRDAHGVIARQQRLLSLKLRSYELPVICARRTLVAIGAYDF